MEENKNAHVKRIHGECERIMDQAEEDWKKRKAHMSEVDIENSLSQPTLHHMLILENSDNS